MLNERFLARLSDEFPGFHERVAEEARADAERLRAGANGDATKALARARLDGAARLWWPYVKGSVPVVGRQREAMEAFSRLVLTVDDLAGHAPRPMEEARAHVLWVLRASLDVERLTELVSRREAEEKKAAAAGASVAASVTALLGPISMLRKARRYARWLPGWGRVAVGAIVLGALASVPVVVAYSAGRKAEEAARLETLPQKEATPRLRGPS